MGMETQIMETPEWDWVHSRPYPVQPHVRDGGEKHGGLSLSQRAEESGNECLDILRKAGKTEREETVTRRESRRDKVQILVHTSNSVKRIKTYLKLYTSETKQCCQTKQNLPQTLSSISSFQPCHRLVPLPIPLPCPPHPHTERQTSATAP